MINFYFKIFCISFSCITIFSIILHAQENYSIQDSDNLAADTVVFTSSNLPIIVIDTHGQTIPDEPKITADMKIIYNGEGQRNAITDTVYNYNGKIGIEARGSSSQQFPKRQFGLETRDISGDGINVSLLDLPAESDWVIYAAYNDKSLMRDFLSYTLARSMGRYATRARYFELVLNGRYWGVYMLFETIKRGKNRVDISKIDTTEISGDTLTGGYIIRIDKFSFTDRGWFSPNPPYAAPSKKILYQYYYPKPEKIVSEQEAYIQNFISSFETVMKSADYTDTVNGYPKYLDISSAVDYLIINELARNVDAYRLSAYMFKDKDSKGGKLGIGPIWDFTNSLGNCDYYDAWLTGGWQMVYLTTNSNFLNYDNYLVPFWWKQLFDDPTFMDKVKSRWIELRQNQLTLQKINGIIDSVAAYIDEAQQRNFIKWPILGIKIWPNYYYFKTYAEEVSFLKNWIGDRLSWIDIELTGGSLDTDGVNYRQPSTFFVYQNYPNPFNSATTIKFQMPSPDFVTLKVFDVMGREISTPVSETLPAGLHIRRWYAGSLSSGVYFYRLEAGNFYQTRKLILVR